MPTPFGVERLWRLRDGGLDARCTGAANSLTVITAGSPLRRVFWTEDLVRAAGGTVEHEGYDGPSV